MRNTLIVMALVAATPALAQGQNSTMSVQDFNNRYGGVMTAAPPVDSPSGSRLGRPVVMANPNLSHKLKPQPPDPAAAAGDAAPKNPDDTSAAQ